MSRAIIEPAPLHGRVTIPPSKSDAHRLLICAALADGVSRIRNMALSKDIEATIRVLKSFGADIRLEGDTAVIRGIRPRRELTVADCGESGSTLRFLMPVAAALGLSAWFTGEGRLPQRPLETLTRLFSEKGLSCTREGENNLPLRLSGRLPAGTYRLPGDISSQYISGLLMALPLTGEESYILLTTPLQSAGYVDMTLRTMAAFGVQVQRLPDGYRIPPGSRYRPTDCGVEGDWSAAAFFLAAGAVGRSVSIGGLQADSAQGDRAAAGLFGRFGAYVLWEQEDLICSPAPLHGAEINVSQVPDLAPALAVTAGFAYGDTVITGGERLRIKESDRLAAIAAGLTAIGVRVDERPDGLIIHGEGPAALHGGHISGVNDHRIVMAFSVAAAYVQGPSVITDAGAVAKSYPAFFDDFIKLGGNAHVI